MNIYWLFLATLLCSFFGYRLAVHYKLSGITGLIISLTLCVTLGTNMWRIILSWLQMGDHLVTASGTLLTVATLFAFVEKYKFIAIVKITSMLLPVSFASVSIPHVATDGTATAIISSSNLLGGNSSSTPRVEVPSSGEDFEAVPDKYYAKVSRDFVLHVPTDRGLVKSPLLVEAGTWVRAGSQVAEASGRRWIHIMLPNGSGHFVPEACAMGYIPLSHISEKRAALPSP
ncbi:MAG: hypothetical protein ACWGQW_17980 [bacterium]